MTAPAAADRRAPAGYLMLVLHAHLPWVRHAEYEDPLEERWLHEAVLECYLPLLETIEGWQRDGIEWSLTLSVSPTLAAMLADPLLQGRMARRLDQLQQLAEQEVIRTRWLPQFNETAWHYLGRIRDARRRYEEEYGRDLLGALRRLAAGGCLELITCNATHGFLPLFQHQPEVVGAQIAIGVEAHRRWMGETPPGLWSAECGYFPGLDTRLARAGLGYTVLDAHALLHGRPRPAAGCRAPVWTPGGVAAFGRDSEAARQVWNAREGYPGDPLYREFYRDAGHDLEYDYIRPYIHESGLRVDTGFKYHRITGEVGLGEKEPYNWNRARARAVEHAAHFAEHRTELAHTMTGADSRPPLIVAPYDAELFGHWWYEGPVFLDHLVRRLHHQRDGLEIITPSAYLTRHGESERCAPAFSSWGEGGYAAPWLNAATEWIYPPLHAAGAAMIQLARRYAGSEDPLLRRLLNQMGRELLLAMASDWAFMMTMDQTADYGRQRTQEHLAAFRNLDRMLHEGAVDETTLAAREAHHGLFPWLRFEVFAGDS